MAFNPSGTKLLIVIRTSLVVDGEIKGLYESDCRDPDYVERGDCKTCFILFDMETSPSEPSYVMCETDGKRTMYYPDELRYARWVTDDIVYYCKYPIIIRDGFPTLINEIGNTEYRDFLNEFKDKNLDKCMANYVLACSLIRTHYSDFPLTRVYVGHNAQFTSTDNGQLFMYYVESKTVYCHQIPSSPLPEGQKIQSVNLPIREVFPLCKPVPDKECRISHVTFNGPDAVLHLVNAEFPRVRVSLSEQGDKLIALALSD